jgi:hypothetical protein
MKPKPFSLDMLNHDKKDGFHEVSIILLALALLVPWPSRHQQTTAT